MDPIFAIVIITIVALVVIVAIVAITYGQNDVAKGALNLLAKLFTKSSPRKTKSKTEEKPTPPASGEPAGD